VLLRVGSIAKKRRFAIDEPTFVRAVETRRDLTSFENVTGTNAVPVTFSILYFAFAAPA
jgi:hypothetical protein